MTEAFIEKYVDDSKKSVYYQLIDKLSAIKDSPIGWLSNIDDSDSNHPYYPHDDYGYLKKINERGKLWTNPKETIEDGRCHKNCIHLYNYSNNLNIVTGFAHAFNNNLHGDQSWIRHTWLYSPNRSVTIDTTSFSYEYYYGYVINESEMKNFDNTFNISLEYKLNGNNKPELEKKYLGKY
jgi:hypothetical protein